MSIVSISGPQGTGKSTVVKTLEELGYNVIPQKTSRSILNEWGFTLNQVNSVNFLTKRFQEEVIKRHTENVAEQLASTDIYIQERSMADIFSYALNILGPFNQHDEFINDYYEQCKKLQQQYAYVIYLAGRPNSTVADDGVRSTNRHFTHAIDLLIRNYINEFNVNDNVLYVETPVHEYRIDLITSKLDQLK